MERFEASHGSPVQMLVPGAIVRVLGAFVVAALSAFVVVAAWLGLTADSVEARVPDVVSGQSVQDELAKFGALAPVTLDDVGPLDDLVPDLSMMVARSGSPADDDGATADSDGDADLWWTPVRAALLDRPEVEAVAMDFPNDDTSIFHVRIDDASASRQPISDLASSLVADMEAAVDVPGGISVIPGGRGVTDEAIVDRYGTSVRWLAVFALLLAGYAVWRLGIRRGAVMALAWFMSTLAAGSISSQVVEPFDGTVATGPLVGAMAGLLFAVAVGLRISKWYATGPSSTDGADSIQRSLAEVASDVTLVLGALLAVVGVLWIVGGSSRGVVAVLVGALVGSAVTGAVAGAALAALGVDKKRSGTVLPFEVPSADQLMLVTVLGLVGLLTTLALFAFRSPGSDFIDYRSLPSSNQFREVGDLLGSGPGDPTEALVSVVSASTDDATRTWAEAVATLSNVAWVDTADRRFTGAGSSEVDSVVSLASEEQIGVRLTELAIIVPAVPIRSVEGAQLIADIDQLADERVEIAGGANSLLRGSTVLVIATVILLAAVGAGTVAVTTGNNGLALTSLVLRLLGGAATVGLYRLLSADASAMETVSALTLAAVVVSLFELEFLHDRSRIGDRWSSAAGVSVNGVSPNGGGRASDRFAVPGRVGLLAAVALVSMSLWVALGRFLGGGPGVGRFGLAVAVAVIVELAVGFLVLRPALLGEQAAYHTVARPLRSTLHAGQRKQRGEPISIDDPAWRRLVSDLLMAEFGLQTDPDATSVDDVFLEGTPLFRQAVDQHRNLTSSGLRVGGRAPQVRRVEMFREGPSIMVSVTVDHPERHLVDYDGTVYGVRRPQRRSTMLWLVGLDDGDVRIAESIDTGSVPLDVDKTPQPTSFPEVATVSG